ncbi:hypothetical protein GOP47_0026555 [Adiantum capillus-veneris]|nr:hypothetical protein GOP47_0026555 [Adiantum capillus-veneris]
MSTLGGVVVLVILGLITYVCIKFLSRGSWPPGPFPLPLIGHLHLVGELPHQSLCKLSRSYGPLLGLRLGSVPTIVASSPDFARKILQTHDSSFASRPRFDAAIHMVLDCSNIAFAPLGPSWRLMRQICATELFTAKRLEGFKHIRVDEIRGIACELLDRGLCSEKAVKLRPTLLAATNRINCRMALGSRITELSSTHQIDLLHLIDDVMYLLGVFNVGDFIPWLRWLDLQGYVKRMKAAGESWSTILQEVMVNRRKAREESDPPPCNDLLDVLLDVSATNKLISDNNIQAILMDLFIGGSETSASTVEWALAELLNNPKEMTMVQEELDKVVGRDRLVEDEDIPNLPYLNAIVKEIFRLHPPVPLLIPRETIQESQLGGYTIPAKTRVFVNVWAIGRDPAIWERPLDFWPKRFLHSNMDFRGQQFEFLPFGSGRRGCPGLGLASLNVHLMLATLVQAFTWSVPSNLHCIDMSEKTGITVTMANPLCALATLRVSSQLL